MALGLILAAGVIIAAYIFYRMTKKEKAIMKISQEPAEPAAPAAPAEPAPEASSVEPAEPAAPAEEEKVIQ